MGKGRLDAAFLLLRELSEPNADPVRFAPDHLAAMRGAVRQKDQRKRSGMPTALVTSKAAPVSDQLRTTQSIAPPPNSIAPAFRRR
jgi:hypothetical protein